MSRDRRAQKRVVLYRAVPADGSSAPHEVAYESLADALHFACRDLRTGRRRPVALVEDGLLVMDESRIAAECEARRADGEEQEGAARRPDEVEATPEQP